MLSDQLLVSCKLKLIIFMQMTGQTLCCKLRSFFYIDFSCFLIISNVTVMQFWLIFAYKRI